MESLIDEREMSIEEFEKRIKDLLVEGIPRMAKYKRDDWFSIDIGGTKKQKMVEVTFDVYPYNDEGDRVMPLQFSGKTYSEIFLKASDKLEVIIGKKINEESSDDD